MLRYDSLEMLNCLLEHPDNVRLNDVSFWGKSVFISNGRWGKI